MLRYGWDLTLLKKQKQGMAGVLFYWNYWNKVQLGFYSIENDKIRYGWGFILLKMQKYDWSFLFLKTLK